MGNPHTVMIRTDIEQVTGERSAARTNQAMPSIPRFWMLFVQNPDKIPAKKTFRSHLKITLLFLFVSCIAFAEILVISAEACLGHRRELAPAFPEQNEINLLQMESVKGVMDLRATAVVKRTARRRIPIGGMVIATTTHAGNKLTEVHPPAPCDHV